MVAILAFLLRTRGYLTACRMTLPQNSYRFQFVELCTQHLGHVRAALLCLDFEDIHFGVAEEAHIEDGADAACDEDAAAALEIEEAGGHGGAERDEFPGEGIT